MKLIPITKQNIAKLNHWLGKHEDFCKNATAFKIKEQFKKDTGIKISETTILKYSEIHYPKVKSIPGGEANGGKILSRLNDHEDHITSLRAEVNSLRAEVKYLNECMINFTNP